MSFRVGLIQNTAKRAIADNLPEIREHVMAARDEGADLITTPECVSMLETSRRRVLEEITMEEDGHPAIDGFAAMAREAEAWLLAGSLTVRVEPERVANRSILFRPDGTIAARYDKMHMFDVDLKGGESYRESKLYRPGEAAVIAETPFAKLGMTICYDLRFPYLYRHLARNGADVLLVPSAFTRPTGQAHWHTLLRARAIETGCWIVAPASTGDHECGRKTYGHSLVVDPWGEVVADGGEAVGLTMAEIDLDRIAEVRQMVPSMARDRPFSPAG